MSSARPASRRPPGLPEGAEALTAALDEPLLLDTPEAIAYWLPQHDITPAKLKQWARRGHITRHPGQRYVMKQVADYLDSRPPIDAARARTLAERNRRLTP